MAFSSFSQELCQIQNEWKDLDAFIEPEKENWCRLNSPIRQLGNLIALSSFRFGPPPFVIHFFDEFDKATRLQGYSAGS